MFSNPLICDDRYIAIADLRDGTQVDLLRGIPWSGDETPADLAPKQPSQRWLQVMIDLPRERSSFFRTSLLRYLAKKWDEQHPDEQAAEYVQYAQIHTRRSADEDEPVIERLVLAQVDLLGDGAYREGQRHGHWVHRFPNGLKEGEGRYLEGKEDGKWTYWYEDGRKEGEGSYVGGQLHGRWVFYLPDGQQREANFHHGRLVPASPTEFKLRDEG
jgi:hypothetical protein